ncbi:MAG: response regulator [Acidobacteria bacterium]|nr:response regulator [Acidobacteriota bacterium]
MTALIVVLMFIAFVVIDIFVRKVSESLKLRRERREREDVLRVSLQLDIADEAKSLKRAEVPNPKARILAVDDEAVVLDSFRRILVLEGFSVDTVETGPEALGLVQRNDYDFLFTDLKMPVMDGVEVVKAVKHLRPDVDVVVITGYGTIETAVQTLQFGACEYVQKPFTAEELGDFARRLLIKREARLEAARKPTIKVVAPALAEGTPAGEFCVPGGAFISSAHAWARLEPNGQVRIGLDDFARKALSLPSSVELPRPGQTVKAGEPLFSLKEGEAWVRFPSPLSGKVVHGNEDLKADPRLTLRSPYDRGWVCLLQPSDLATELPGLRIGKPLVDWYQEEIARLRAQGASAPAAGPVDPAAFEREFLGGRPAATV